MIGTGIEPRSVYSVQMTGLAPVNVPLGQGAGWTDPHLPHLGTGRDTGVTGHLQGTYLGR